MAMGGFYRRVLPSPPAIDFTSTDGKQLFSEALQSGTMEGFFKLISYFQTQSEPAYCGLASLSMVLNALAIDPGRKWKGPWRWYDESMLDCCEPLEKVKADGISFGKVVCLAHCAGVKVDSFRTTQSRISDFREFIIACSGRDDCHMISSYDRGKLEQTGSGHFSPIGGYHAGKDMALILDVARFKYPPHWVPVTLLWEAMNTVDKASGLHRGFATVLLEFAAQTTLMSDVCPVYILETISKAYTTYSTLRARLLSCKHESWAKIVKYLVEDVPLLLGSEDMRDIKKVISAFLLSLPLDFEEFIKWIAEVRRQEDCDDQYPGQEEKGRIGEEVLKQLQGTGLYTYVREFFLSDQKFYGITTKAASQDNLTEVAAKVCYTVAEFLSGEKPVMVISGTVVNGNGEKEMDLLVPSSPRRKSCYNCQPEEVLGMFPASHDILTILLFALPTQTWSGLQQQKLSEEIRSLVSIKLLPTLLQEQVLHLRGQLQLLQRCRNNKVDEDFGSPLP